MELWIRGQRKGLLIKINSHIRISECNGYYCLLQNEYYLGKYATKERAIEILDEIQNYILLPNTDNSAYVYQMSED